MEVTARSLRGTRVITVAGDVDLSSVVDIQAHVDAAFSNGEHLLVIDLERVDFLDSAVLHTLFRTLRRVRAKGGDISLVCVNPMICRLLEVFGLSAEIQICSNVPSAAAAIAPD